MDGQAPAHSVALAPALVHREAYEAHNRYLFLLLGIIALAEHSFDLTVADADPPMRATADPAETAPPRDGRADGLFR